MMTISSRLFRNDTVHRQLTADPFNGVLSCGFLHKVGGPGRQISDRDIVFNHYGGLLVLSGTGTHTDSEGRVFPLSQGSFVQRLPGRVHSTHVEPDGAWLEFFICIGRDLFESLVRLRVLDDRQEVLTPGISPALVAGMEGLLENCRRGTEHELPFLLMEAQRLLVTLTQLHRNAVGADETGDWVARACRIMGERAAAGCGTILIEEIAMLVGVGYERFRKGFRERVGMAPAEYYRRRRINNAQSMLADGQKSVKQVAYLLGYPDAASFSKQFHQSVGVSPDRFRTLMRNE